MQNTLLTGMQLTTSIARLAAFALSVLIIGAAPGTGSLVIVIGYLPFLAFFDILIQSSSRAAHLQGASPSSAMARYRNGYAIAALVLIAVAFAGGFWFPAMRKMLVLGAWPLGAIGFVWERWIAQRVRQWMLAVTELSLLIVAIVLQHFAELPWPVLLLCIVSFPVARLIVLVLPARSVDVERTVATPSLDGATAGPSPFPSGRWSIGRYIGASLVQQMIGSAAVSVPAIYAQVSGDWDGLALHVAVFRSLHSMAAIISLTINATSSRIFYRQMGSAFDTFEARILGYDRWIMAFVLLIAAVAGTLAAARPGDSAGFALIILPAMAIINAESSLLYNRGLPIGTTHCQILILLLSCAFMTTLLGSGWGAAVALMIFTGYGALVTPAVLRSHRRALHRA